MPPTDFCNYVTSTCGHEPELPLLAGTMASTTFRFSPDSALSLAEAAVERRAALRPVSTTPLPVPPTCVGLPDLDIARTAPPPNELPRRCVVTIDAHGSEDREKDFAYPGRKWRFQIALASGACALKGRTRTRFPSSASSGHPLSSVLAPTREDPPADDVDRPRPVFRRVPAKETGFPQAGMPDTATLRPLSTRLLPPEVRRRPPAHAAQHVFPRLGKGALTGIASATLRSPAMHDVRECEHLFYLLVLLVPGTDDPSTPTGSDSAAVCGNRLSRSLPTLAAVP